MQRFRNNFFLRLLPRSNKRFSIWSPVFLFFSWNPYGSKNSIAIYRRDFRQVRTKDLRGKAKDLTKRGLERWIFYFTGSYKYHNLSTLNQICISVYHLLEDTRHCSDKSYMRVSGDCAFVLHLMNNYFYKKST